MRVVVFLVAAFFSVVASGTVVTESTGDVSPRTSVECGQIGFNKLILKCRHCQPLLQHTGSAELHKECLSCCTVDDQVPPHIYAFARLEMRGIHSELKNPQSEVGIFYKNYKEKFGRRLKVAERQSAFLPRLVLVDENGGEELDTVIVGWTRKALHDYLVQALGMDE